MHTYLFFVHCSYKPDWSDDIYGWSSDRGHDPLPVCGHSEVYHKRCATHGQNPLGVHT